MLSSMVLLPFLVLRLSYPRSSPLQGSTHRNATTFSSWRRSAWPGFPCEFCLRFVQAQNKCQFFQGPLNIIDIMAIFPYTRVPRQ